LSRSTNVDPESNNWYHNTDLLQQLVSELKVDEGLYVEAKKFYDKLQDREVQRQRKFRFMVKEAEDVIGARGSSQDLIGKVSKICRYVKQG